MDEDPAPGRRPRTMGAWHRYRARMEERPFVAAWQGVVLATLSVTVVGGLLVRITDPGAFATIWDGMWWAAQTVTTVGYGDRLPTSPMGRLIGVVVMLVGVAFLTVTTAAIVSVFAESRSRRAASGPDDPLRRDLERLDRRLDELMAEVRAVRERMDERER